MTIVKREPLADQAASALLERIRSGEWALGAKLPGELHLGPQLGVGRSTVREALRQLQGRGVVEARQGAGVFVVALDVPEEWDAVLRRSSIKAVLEARIAIEAEAAALAAERRTATELRAIRRALSERQASNCTTEELVDADMRLHRAVVSAAHNPLLTELFDSFVPRIRRAMVELLRAGAQWSPAHNTTQDHEAHAALVEAIAQGDAEQASRLSRAHLAALAAAL